MKKIIILLIIIVFNVIPENSISQNLSITIYNKNYSLVKQSLEMTLQKGIQNIISPAVTEYIEPASVRVLSEDKSFFVKEQVFMNDFSNSYNLLQKNIGKTIVAWNEEGQFIEGKLISAMDDLIIEGKNGTITILKQSAVEHIEFKEENRDTYKNPVFQWKVDSRKSGNSKYNLSYITQEIGWSAEYNMVLDKEEKNCEIDLWATIDNRTCVDFENAEIKLVSGDIQKKIEPSPAFGMGLLKNAEKTRQFDTAQESASEEKIFEYHSYKIDDLITLNSKEQKQVSLFSGKKVEIKKEYVYEPRKNNEKVSIVVEFLNSSKSGIGIALPQGKIKVYKLSGSDCDFIGEDTIQHISINEEVRISTGYAFDIAAERNVMESRVISPRVNEDVIEINIKNRKNEPVTVKVTENVWGNWEITEKTHEYLKKNANTIEFSPSVAAGEEAKIKYTIRYKNRG